LGKLILICFLKDTSKGYRIKISACLFHYYEFKFRRKLKFFLIYLNFDKINKVVVFILFLLYFLQK